MPENVKRRYESPRRRAQADATRRDIIAAAQRLFERHGYAATTMAAIAAEAGVALKTVYLTVETKSGVLRAVWNTLLRGDDADRPVAEQRWYVEVLEETDPDSRLLLNARNSAEGKRRIAAIVEVIRSAATADPEIGALWTRIQTEYHANQRPIVEGLHDRGQVAQRLGAAGADDSVWASNQ